MLGWELPGGRHACMFLVPAAAWQRSSTVHPGGQTFSFGFLKEQGGPAVSTLGGGAGGRLEGLGRISSQASACRHTDQFLILCSAGHWVRDC